MLNRMTSACLFAFAKLQGRLTQYEDSGSPELDERCILEHRLTTRELAADMEAKFNAFLIGKNNMFRTYIISRLLDIYKTPRDDVPHPDEWIDDIEQWTERKRRQHLELLEREGSVDDDTEVSI